MTTNGFESIGRGARTGLLVATLISVGLSGCAELPPCGPTATTAIKPGSTQARVVNRDLGPAAVAAR
jgi:hypothetical protein